jgi:chromosome partitioning protein
MRLRRRERVLEDEIPDVPDEPEKSEPEKSEEEEPPASPASEVDHATGPASVSDGSAPSGATLDDIAVDATPPDTDGGQSAGTEVPATSALAPEVGERARIETTVDGTASGPVVVTEAMEEAPGSPVPVPAPVRSSASAPASNATPAPAAATPSTVLGATIPWDQEAEDLDEGLVVGPPRATPDEDPVPTPVPTASRTRTRIPASVDDESAAGDLSTPKKVRSLPRVLAVANQKGGVGKTTTTVNLGAALAELGYRVLVVDLDPQGNATTGLGIDARNFELSMYDVIMRDTPMEDCIEPTSVKNLFVAPATIDLAGVEIELVPAFSRELKLKKAIDSVVEDFDFILIDCPPSLGLITVNGLAAAREVLVPIQCEYYALEGLSQLLRNVHLVASNLNSELEVSTIVLTMFDARTRLAIDVADEVRSHFADRVCRSIIPRTVRLSEAPSFGQPITVFDPTSRGAVAYRELAKEVSNGAPKRAG